MLPLLEQPDDWTEPGAHAVVDHVYRIPLALPVDGLAAVNVYAEPRGSGGLILIIGCARPETEKAPWSRRCRVSDTGSGTLTRSS